MKKIGIIKEYTVSITISGILLLLGMIVIFTFNALPTHRELIKFITAVIGGLSAIYSAFFVAESLKLKVNHDLIKNSFDLIRELNDINLVRYRIFLGKNFDHNNIKPAEMYDSILSNEDIHITITSLLNVFSRVSLSIRRNHADEKTLYMALDTILPSTFNMLLPYVKEERKKRSSEDIYRNIEMLAEHWQAKKMLSSGHSIEDIYNFQQVNKR